MRRCSDASTLTATTENVTALTFDFPAGHSPFAKAQGVKVVDRWPGDRSTGGVVRRVVVVVAAPRRRRVEGRDRCSSDAPRKRHDLQGPIDDAFMDSFIFVRPTGESPNAAFAEWCDAELDTRIEHWRRHFRGDARVKDDIAITDDDIANANLVLWGDPSSNAVLKRIAEKLPIGWNGEAIQVGEKSFPSDQHALILDPTEPAESEPLRCAQQLVHLSRVRLSQQRPPGADAARLGGDRSANEAEQPVAREGGGGGLL